MSRASLVALAFAMLICLTSPLSAQASGNSLANKQLADPKAEAKATELMKSLRCVQCQGQSIADSDAPIAELMRHEVRQRIAKGESAGWWAAMASISALNQHFRGRLCCCGSRHF
jgi:cytochrome c-type biogenesis protein CcmH/NrfF